MAATRGTVKGGNSSSDTGTASRLGSRYVVATADTWQTFARVTTWADGRVVVSISDDSGHTLASLTLSRETKPGEDGRRAVTFERDHARTYDTRYAEERTA